MDYFLITEAFFPEQSCVELFTETIVKLPYQHFEPLASLPKIKELPALNNGFTTFASFNRANKISRECVNLWARILKNSNSKMIVGGLMQNSKDNNNIKKWFAEEGIKEDVVEYYSIMPLNELMILLNNKVDICLDSFPYGGGTTSWLAISMGVPTISLEGESPASKVGASILRSMGLKNYIANDQAEYYLIATTVINEIKKLNEIRLKMRSRFYKSNSSKPKLSAASLIYLFKKTWEIYNTKSSKIFVIDTQSVKNIYKINNYKRLMYLQYKNGNFEECLKTADKIIKLDKNNLAAIKLKGTLCLHKGEIERGIILFESISDELDEEAVNNLAVGYQKVGSSEKAKELLKK
jgi:tetratricopeptide (TPR) repeat protein